MKFLIPMAFLPVLVCGQAAPASSAPGKSSSWDLSQAMDELSAQANRMKHVVEELKPQEWTAKGAPEAYVSQWRGAESELGYMLDSAKALQKQPEKLTAALDTYFRMQSVEMQLTSLADGARSYQDPSMGDQLVSLVGGNSLNRDKLREYITDLAATRQQEFDIADKEAQRCRVDLSRQAPARAPQAAAPKLPSKPADPKSK